MILDSNVLIYLSKYLLKPEVLITSESSISIVTKIETLGFNFKSRDENILLESIINELIVIPLSDQIAEEAIRLRRKYKIRLADAIIYATAVAQKLPLLTNNTSDFTSLDNQVILIDPFTI